MNRRTALKSLPLLSITPVASAAATEIEERDSIWVLIERHRAAYEDLNEACKRDICKWGEDSENEREYYRTSAIEAEAAIALYLRPTKEGPEREAKREYIIGHPSLNDYFGYSPHVDKLIDAVVDLSF